MIFVGLQIKEKSTIGQNICKTVQKRPRTAQSNLEKSKANSREPTQIQTVKRNHEEQKKGTHLQVICAGIRDS